MSSWKKASKVNQKTHRERHQPESRNHLGFLEKHKDYVKRARDYQRKQNVIKKLKEKALNKNPDEFYMHMVNAEVADGLHRDKKKTDSEHTVEQKKLLENKSLTYVNLKYNIERKKVEKMKSEMHMINLRKNSGSHTFFNDDDDDEVRGKSKRFSKTKEKPSENEDSDSDEEESLKPVSSDYDSRFTNEDLDKSNLSKMSISACKNLHKKKLKKYRELAKRIERKQQLLIAHRKIEINQCLKKSKNDEKPKLIQPASKSSAPVYKWKYQRKR